MIDKPAAPPASQLIASYTAQDVDLSGGEQHSFSISGLPAGKQLYLSAMLAEAGGALPPNTAPTPKSGDLVVAPQAFTAAPGGTTSKSLSLDARWQ